MSQCLICKKDPAPRKVYCPNCKPHVPYTGTQEYVFETLVLAAMGGCPIEDLQHRPGLVRYNIDLYDVEEEYKRRLAEEAGKSPASQYKKIDWFLDE